MFPNVNCLDLMADGGVASPHFAVLTDLDTDLDHVSHVLLSVYE
jgi:hypothetical protein